MMNYTCLNCGRSEEPEVHLLRSPGVAAICPDCVSEVVEQVRRLSPGEVSDIHGAQVSRHARCSFCGRDSLQSRGIVHLNRGAICFACTDFCLDVLNHERANLDPKHRVAGDGTAGIIARLRHL